jgi:hypothetical protein
MKRRLLVLAFLVVLAPAVPSTAAPNGGQDRVVGGARDAFDANVSFSARSGPSGQNPHGHINATVPFPGTPGDTLQFRLEVTCLAVAGNLAAAGAVVTESSSNDVPERTSSSFFEIQDYPAGRETVLRRSWARKPRPARPFSRSQRRHRRTGAGTSPSTTRTRNRKAGAFQRGTGLPD